MQGKLQDGSIIICGTLPKDAEHKQVGEKNSHLTKFGVKVGERKVEGQDKPEAIWVNCDCWHEVAKAAKNLKKFDVVLCVGKIKITEHEGKTYKNLECEFVIPMSKAVEAITGQTSNAPLPQDFEEIMSDDGVPF